MIVAMRAAGRGWTQRPAIARLTVMFLTHDSAQQSKCRANNAPLSPIPWLERAALLFPSRTAIRYDDITMTYSDLMVRN